MKFRFMSFKMRFPIAIGTTPFVAKTQAKPIKVRSTDTVKCTNSAAPTELRRFWGTFCYKQGRYYVPFWSS